MKQKIFDELYIQNEDPKLGYVYVDYENALKGKFLDYISALYEELKDGSKKPLKTPVFAENQGGIIKVIPNLSLYVSLAFSGYAGKKQNQRFIITVGQQGAGKSSLALKGNAYIYAYNSMNPKEAPPPDFALDPKYYPLFNYILGLFHLVIDPVQLTRFIEFLERYGLRAPILVIDDAQLFFSTMEFLRNREVYVETDKIMTLMRSRIMTVVMTTSVDVSKLHSTIKNMEGIYKISVVSPPAREIVYTYKKIKKNATNFAQARVYRKTTKNHFMKTNVSYKDYMKTGLNYKQIEVNSSDFVYNVLLPDPIYNIYNRLRESYIPIVRGEHHEKQSA